MSNKFIQQLEDPTFLEGVADFLVLVPVAPAGYVAAGLRLAAKWIRAGKSVDEVNAIVARYSAEAQDLADHWSNG